MKIIQIEFSELKNLGNFQHRKIGATATIADDENPDDVIKALRDWVVTQQERFRCETRYEEAVIKEIDNVGRYGDVDEQLPF